ncbi:MAG: DUF2975 domain-containing protein [Clostridia bacterium]|nr:DUF2975 domain-containing protein [Clostridia bacterium]
MKLVGKKRLSGVLEMAVWVLMLATVIIIVALPWIIDWMMQFNQNEDFWRPRYLVTLMVSSGFALLLQWELRGILRNANRGTIFSDNTVRRLRTMGVESLLLAAFYAVMLFCGMTKFSVALILLIFLLTGLLLLIFGELFLQAIEYKQENDMTI